MGEMITKFIRYLYLDVVDFTSNRSVEAQTVIVETLNGIVRKALSKFPVAPERIIFLPTGDGLGIALLDEMSSYDIHLLLALQILSLISQNNASGSDEMRKFQVRIGLSENTDNIVTDINGNRNVAGHGINTAQRVMSLTDASQILVSQTVYETLSHREKYMKHFRRYSATLKHSVSLSVQQFIDESWAGLSVTEPSLLAHPQTKDVKLNLYQAYFLAHALKNQSFALKHLDPLDQDALNIVYHFMAEDSSQVTRSGTFDEPLILIYGEGKASIEQVFHYYRSLNLGVRLTLGRYIAGLLADCEDLFERSFYAVKDTGIVKIKEDFPGIFKEFAL